MNYSNVLKKVTTIAATGILAFSLFTPAYAKTTAPVDHFKVGNKLVVKGVNVGKSPYILSRVTKDVNGDKKADLVLLTGNKTKRSDIYADNLAIVVRDGKTKRFITSYLKGFGGYEPTLKAVDFTGDKVSDVMIKAPTGGSGGIVDHRIVTFQKNTPKTIFTEKDNDGIQFEGYFYDGFKVKGESKALHKEMILDLSNNKKFYIDHFAFAEDGTSTNYDKVTSYPYGSLQVVDLDGKGTYSLVGSQRIVGLDNTDTLSNVNSTWKYANGKWAPVEVEYSTFLVK